MYQSFGKGYKLCSKIEIDLLFQKKKTLKTYPFVLNYAKQDLKTDKQFQIVLSAPKKIFRKAHERNRIKRLMKEVIRKKKLILEDYLEENNTKLALFLIYTVKEELKYQVLENKMEQLLTKLVSELKQTNHDKID